MANYFITVNKDNIVTDIFSDEVKTPQPTDIKIQEKVDRVCPYHIKNSFNCYKYKYENYIIVERTVKECMGDPEYMDQQKAVQNKRIEQQIFELNMLSIPYLRSVVVKGDKANSEDMEKLVEYEKEIEALKKKLV